MFSKADKQFSCWNLLVIFLVIRSAVTFMINALQYRYINQASVPLDMSKFINQDQWLELSVGAKKYFKIVFATDFVNQAFQISLVGLGLICSLWNWSAYFFKTPIDKPPYWHSILFAGSYFLIKFAINLSADIFLGLSFPLALLHQIMNPIIVILLVGIFSYFLFLQKKLPYASIIMPIASIVGLSMGVFLSPYIFMKAFDSFPPGNIKQSLQEILTKVNFPREHLLLDKGYPTTCVLGVGKHAFMVVGGRLIQTLGGEAGLRKIAAAIYQELGHWKYNHDIYLFPQFLMVHGIVAFAFWYFINRPQFYTAFGIQYNHESALPFGIGIVFADILASQGSFWIGPLMNYIEWMTEYQADGFAVKNGYADDLKEVLLIMLKSHPQSLATYAFGLIRLSRPVISSRLSAIEALAYKITQN